jgi:hypothetical protein
MLVVGGMTNNRREQLKAIISRLGSNASAPEIRMEAYKAGFGTINGHMLVTARNELWPDRRRHGGGRSAGGTAATVGAIQCPKCNSCKTRAQQRRIQRDGTAKRTVFCRNCSNRFVAVGSSEKLLPKSASIVAASLLTEKTCGACRQTLPIGNFGRRPSKIDDNPRTNQSLYRSYCKGCMNERRHLASIRSKLEKFGLTVAEYDAMLAKQGGGCAICGTPPDSQKRKRILCLDHCHSTGKVRGLLCSKCNLGIGNFSDDVERLEVAITYLKASRELAGGKEVTHG